MNLGEPTVGLVEFVLSDKSVICQTLFPKDVAFYKDPLRIRIII